MTIGAQFSVFHFAGGQLDEVKPGGYRHVHCLLIKNAGTIAHAMLDGDLREHRNHVSREFELLFGLAFGFWKVIGFEQLDLHRVCARRGSRPDLQLKLFGLERVNVASELGYHDNVAGLRQGLALLYFEGGGLYAVQTDSALGWAPRGIHCAGDYILVFDSTPVPCGNICHML